MSSDDFNPAAFEDPVDRALAWALALDPALGAGLEGAAPGAIDALAAGLPRPMSRLHRRFLERLGARHEGIDLGPVDATPATLLDAHEHTEGALPPGYELLARSMEDPYLDAFLVHQPSGEARVGTTYSIYGGDFADLAVEKIEVVAGSLAELICLPVLVRCRYQQLPFQMFVAHPELGPEPGRRFDALVEENELSLLWFSNSLTRVVELEEGLILAQGLPHAPFSVSVATTSRVELAALKWWLIHEVGLVPQHAG